MGRSWVTHVSTVPTRGPPMGHAGVAHGSLVGVYSCHVDRPWVAHGPPMALQWLVHLSRMGSWCRRMGLYGHGFIAPHYVPSTGLARRSAMEFPWTSQ